MKALKKHFSVILCVCILSVLTLPAFAATSSSAANSCETLGLIKGNGSGVTDSYLSQNATRLQATTLILRLLGLEDEAKNFIGTDNFSDVGELNNSNQAILAYLKANPQLGFSGYGNNKFEPLTKVTAREFYKVLLTALGYSQGVDFGFSSAIEFANKIGLTDLGALERPLMVGDLCTGMAQTLQIQPKDTEKTLIEGLVEKKVIPIETAQNSGLMPLEKPKPPIYVYIPAVAAQPTITTVSYTAHKLTVKLDCATAGATIYYTYSPGGTAAVPTVSSPNHVSAGTSVEINDANGDTINIRAIAVASGMENSAVTSYVRNGYIIEAIKSSSVATLSGHTITLEGSTTVANLLAALQISSGASVHIYETSACTGSAVTSGYICEGYTLRVSSGYNADDLNDYSFVLATAATPMASVPSGAQTSSISVELTSPSGGDIYYTLDGTTPTSSCTKYSGALTINSNKTLKAISVVPGMENSEVLVRDYTF